MLLLLLLKKRISLVSSSFFFFGRPTGVARVCVRPVCCFLPPLVVVACGNLCRRAARPSGAAQHQKTFDNKTHAEKKKEEEEEDWMLRAVVYNPG
jgi:hypothetical protein